MKGKRHTTEEKIRMLREVDSGKPIRELCQEKNISETPYENSQDPRDQASLRSLIRISATWIQAATLAARRS
jgi:hypothetical protein